MQIHLLSTYISLAFIIATCYYFIRKWAAGGICPQEYLNKDLSGKVAIITGGTAGIGLETAKHFAKQGAHVIIAGRSKQRAKKALNSISSTKQIEFMHLDLSDLESVRSFAKLILKRNLPIHYLINNAGNKKQVLLPHIGIAFVGYGVTRQGIEKYFGTNHLGHYLLSLLLLKNIKTNNGRIVNVSSLSYRECNTMIYDKLNTSCSDLSLQFLYGHSKFAQIAFTYELEKRLRADGNTTATTVCLHPGLVSTEIFNNFPWWARIISAIPLFLFSKTPYQGAQTSLYCALAPQVKGGWFYRDCKAEKITLHEMMEENAKKLWEVSEKLVYDFLQ